MYKQTGPTEFIFSLKLIPPECRYGDNPHLDQLGATIHLIPTYQYEDKEQVNWINENGIEYTTEKTDKYRCRIIKFATEEDTMAFKLRWL